jgi:pimeloyl-ACP methyl ester carboxylesterase
MDAINPERDLLSLPLPRLKAANIGGETLVHYREAGDQAAPAILFLHGLGSNSNNFRAQLAGLSDRFRVIAWDAPGIGGSTPSPRSDPGSGYYVDVVRRLAERLGIGRFHLVGSSWGSVIAACFAAQQPELLLSLVLLSPNRSMGELQGAEREAALQQWLSPHGVIGAAPDVLAGMLTGPNSKDRVRFLAGSLLDAASTAGFENAVRMMFNVNTLEVARQIAVRTLIITGAADQLAPKEQHGEPLHALIGGSRIEVIDGIGHLVELEAPAEVNELIRQHASG